MKKLMTALAVCLAAGFAAASGGGVVSSNVVGYMNESSPDGVWIQSIKFSKVGTAPQTICSLSNVLNYTTLSVGDQLWVYDAGTGDYIQLEMRDDLEWHNFADNLVVDVTVKPGDAALLVSNNTLTFCGQVPTLTSYVHTLNGTDGVYMIGSAIPANTTIASFDWASSLSVGDQLWIYDAGTGDYIQYEWRAPGSWFAFSDNAELATSTSLNRGFLLITSATTITQNL